MASVSLGTRKSTIHRYGIYSDRFPTRRLFCCDDVGLGATLTTITHHLIKKKKKSPQYYLRIRHKSVLQTIDRTKIESKPKIQKSRPASATTQSPRPRAMRLQHRARRSKHVLACAHTASEQSSPVHPWAHVHTSGNVQLPLCWHGVAHTGSEQSYPVHPCHARSVLRCVRGCAQVEVLGSHKVITQLFI